jgi:TRAP-type C4-dicarboxylate transport system permease small subunit
MEGKTRFVFPVVITAIIVFVVSGAVTFFNIGWRNDFVIRWWSAFAIGWPIAASTAYLAIPFARSLTQRIVAAIEKDCPLDLGRPTASAAAGPVLVTGSQR